MTYRLTNQKQEKKSNFVAQTQFVQLMHNTNFLLHTTMTLHYLFSKKYP